jgi:hypothetical protein
LLFQHLDVEQAEHPCLAVQFAGILLGIAAFQLSVAAELEIDDPA